MKRWIIGMVAAAAVGFACLAPVSSASAQHHHHGHHGHGHGGYGGVQIYSGYGGGYGGYGSYYGGRVRSYRPYNSGHYDYHGPSLQWHGNHFDVVPGHYDYHRGPHYGW